MEKSSIFYNREHRGFMKKVPFWRFVVTFIFFNKDIPYVVEKLKSFGYYTTDEEMSSFFSTLKKILPESITDMLKNRVAFNLNEESHVEWLKHFGVFEYYDYIIRNKDLKKEDKPDYFKWCEDCLWVHKHRDVMTLMNILLFNKEPLDDISKIIMFKYQKKIGVKTIELYQSMFWDMESMTAKEALYYCLPFRENALVIKKIRGGAGTAVGSFDDNSHDGSDVPFNFHTTDYVKWKIGYHDVSVPTSRDFFENVKKDSYFKYYEVMNMAQSIESEEESGSNEKLGEFSSNKTKRRNVEEQRAKLSKHWLDIFIKAENAMPGDPQEKDDFFKKMRQLELEFADDEKIASIDDMPNVEKDIKGDIAK